MVAPCSSELLQLPSRTALKELLGSPQCDAGCGRCERQFHLPSLLLYYLRLNERLHSIFFFFFFPERRSEVRFTSLKQEGNDFVKRSQYQEALGKYTECLKLKPEECAIYTNRWVSVSPSMLLPLCIWVWRHQGSQSQINSGTKFQTWTKSLADIDIYRINLPPDRTVNHFIWTPNMFCYDDTEYGTIKA